MLILDGEFDTSIIDKMNKTVNVPNVSDKIQISFSIGHATYNPKKELSLDEVLKISDKNMYIDKQKNKKKKNK